VNVVAGAAPVAFLEHEIIAKPAGDAADLFDHLRTNAVARQEEKRAHAKSFIILFVCQFLPRWGRQACEARLRGQPETTA